MFYLMKVFPIPSVTIQTPSILLVYKKNPDYFNFYLLYCSFAMILQLMIYLIKSTIEYDFLITLLCY